jgi:hypothetical protein
VPYTFCSAPAFPTDRSFPPLQVRAFPALPLPTLPYLTLPTYLPYLFSLLPHLCSSFPTNFIILCKVKISLALQPLDFIFSTSQPSPSNIDLRYPDTRAGGYLLLRESRRPALIPPHLHQNIDILLPLFRPWPPDTTCQHSALPSCRSCSARLFQHPFSQRREHVEPAILPESKPERP